MDPLSRRGRGGGRRTAGRCTAWLGRAESRGTPSTYKYNIVWKVSYYFVCVCDLEHVNSRNFYYIYSRIAGSSAPFLYVIINIWGYNLSTFYYIIYYILESFLEVCFSYCNLNICIYQTIKVEKHKWLKTSLPPPLPSLLFLPSSPYFRKLVYEL